MRLPTVFVAFFAFIASTAGSTAPQQKGKLILTLPPSLPVASVPSSSHATLSSKNLTISAPFTRSGTFEFALASLPLESYLCDVYIRDYTVGALKVDVVAVASEKVKTTSQKKKGVEVYTTFRGREWDGKSELLGSSSPAANEDEDVRIELRIGGMRSFYEERQGFSPLSLLKNPMILIGIAGLAMVVGMPKLLDNMDPEMREEFEKAQKSSPLAGAASGGGLTGGFDVAGFLAGSQSGSGNGNGKSAESEGSRDKGAKRR